MPDEGLTALLQQVVVERPLNGTGIELTLLRDVGLVADGCTESPPRLRSGSWPGSSSGTSGCHGRFIVGTLWLDARDQQAAPSLRSALWRVGKSRTNLAHVRPGRCLSLGPKCPLDVHRLPATAQQLRSAAPVTEVAEQLFKADLLPGWDDEWFTTEREQLRQIRLSALGRIADRRLAGGDVDGAIRAGTSAVRCGPVRESSHRILIRAHVVVGNLRRGDPPVRALPPVARRPPRAHTVDPHSRPHGGALGA